MLCQTRPPPTYDHVRSVAWILSRINVGLIEKHFGLSADTAQVFMARLVAERQVGDLQPDGWHYPPIRKLRLRRSRRKPKATSEFEVAEDTADQPTSLEDLAERIRELEQEGDALRATVRRLQDAGKAEIRQREEWRARALAAEAERDRHAGDHDRFDALRRLIARKLHPDYADGGDLEKLLRQEFFKRIWPEIERLATQK